MADVQELPTNRAEIAARRDKDGLLDLLDAKLEHYLHTLHEYQEAMQQLSKELSSANEAQGSDLPKPKEDDAESTPDSNSQPSQNSEKANEETNSTEKPTDPLRWFGILVPPALRTARSTFIGAVEGPIPQLVTILRDLRTQEIEIGRIRKQIKKT
ncbi:unnamed protein product [Alternaria alternata]